MANCLMTYKRLWRRFYGAYNLRKNVKTENGCRHADDGDDDGGLEPTCGFDAALGFCPPAISIGGESSNFARVCRERNLSKLSFMRCEHFTCRCRAAHFDLRMRCATVGALRQ